MALKVQDFTATGKSTTGINYTFIVRVTENSVSAEMNSSNVTIQAILKSGYTKTSFIYQASKITVRIGEEVIISADALRTCEGTEEHVYEVWTGDVFHDEDGSGEVEIYGVFDSLSTFSAMPPVMRAEGTMELTQIILNSPPEIPQGLTAPALVGKSAEVDVRWDIPVDPDGNLKEYELQRSDDGGENFYTIYIGSSEECPDKAADIAGLKMLYRVCAIDHEGVCSGWSDPVTVTVNSPPRVRGSFNPKLFEDAACTTAARSITAGRPLWLYPGRWTDPDGNLEGGGLAVQIRTQSRTGTESQWEDFILFAIEEDAAVELLPDEPDSVVNIQYRVACVDELGDHSDWTEFDWVQLNHAYSFCDGRWMKPMMLHAVMPFVVVNGQWVRHGGVVPGGESSRLGVARLGELILGG